VIILLSILLLEIQPNVPFMIFRCTFTLFLLKQTITCAIIMRLYEKFREIKKKRGLVKGLYHNILTILFFLFPSFVNVRWSDTCIIKLCWYNLGEKKFSNFGNFYPDFLVSMFIPCNTYHVQFSSAIETLKKKICYFHTLFLRLI